MNISYHDFNTLFSAACDEDDRDRYIAEWSSSTIFYPDSDVPDIDADEIVDVLENIWYVAHLTVRDIRQHMGLTQVAFAERFCIKLRTVQNWEAQRRKAPPHTVLMMAKEAGLLRVNRT